MATVTGEEPDGQPKPSAWNKRQEPSLFGRADAGDPSGGGARRGQAHPGRAHPRANANAHNPSGRVEVEWLSERETRLDDRSGSLRHAAMSDARFVRQSQDQWDVVSRSYSSGDLHVDLIEAGKARTKPEYRTLAWIPAEVTVGKATVL
jgi:hypothetical protein